jgi:hypothetical protein
MAMRVSFVVGTLGILLFACGGGGGTPDTQPDPRSETAPTSPSAGQQPAAPSPSPDQGQEATKPAAPSTLSASPTCGTKGNRIVLKLGLTRDHRVPDCYRAEDAEVEFTPSVRARVTLMGPTSDGYCALDVEVPEKAESGTVTVDIGKDEFESDVVFGIPCP